VSDCRYCLELADGSVWVFAATEEASGWLHELARIMELTPTGKKGTRRIYFSAEGDLKASNPPMTIGSGRNGKNGWRPYRNGGVYRVWRHETIPEVHMELNEAFVAHPEIKYVNMWSALREIHRHALGAGGTPIHAALASHHGRGVLIAAPGETGKSTCYRRLPGVPWQALCDDQTLVLKDHNGSFRAHPFPTWSDHLWRESKNSWAVERAVPLSAIFFLEQASTDRATPVNDPAEAVLSVFEAAKQVWSPCWERVSSDEKKNASSLLFHNVSEIAGAVPCFRLSATLEGEFWKEMEEALA
jgi:SynChlorMet cassette protein ScmC